MPRVAPAEYDEEEEYAPGPRHHTPNASHFKEVADGTNQQLLVDFEKYTIRKADEEDINSNKRYTEGERPTSDGRRRSVKRQHQYGAPGTAPQTQRTSKTIGTTIIVTPCERKPGKFLQCDVQTGLIIMTYILCVMITIVAIWCYRQDSMWDGIVHSEQPFPELQNEYFFRGKYLFIPEHEEGLRHAKHYLVRENRWFELMHVMFMCAFLILTLFQLVAYITRGNEDHSRLIIWYYTVFGGLGLIVAIFPLLSWYSQEENYKVAAHYLQDFSRRQWILPRDKWVPGLTNATAQDAWTLGNIMKFCYDASQDGISLNTDSKYISLFRKKYTMKDLQILGFCTYHWYKIFNTIMSVFFALICCLIPCLFCLDASNRRQEPEQVREKTVVETRERPRVQQQPPPTEEQYRPRSGSRESRRSVEKERGFDQRDLSQKQINLVDKWRRHVEEESN